MRPESFLLTVDGALYNKKVGLAGYVSNDVTDIMHNISGMAGYRYRIDIDDKWHTLSLGLSAGFVQTAIDFTKIRIENSNDKALFKSRESNTAIDGNLGILYTWKDLRVGLSTFHLLANSMTFTNQNDKKDLTYRLIRHFYGTVSYRKNFNREIDVEPSIMVKSGQGMPLQFDIGSYVNYKSKVWFGSTFMYGYGLSFSLGGIFYHRYTLAYSYDYALGSIQRFAGATHEIVLGVKLFPPRTDEDGKPLGAPDDDVEKLKRYSQEQYEEIEKLHTSDKGLKNDIVTSTKDITIQKEELESLRKAFLKDSGSIQDVIKKYKDDSEMAEKQDGQKVRLKYNRSDSAYIDTTIESGVKNLNYYVVLGTFLKLGDAKMFQRLIMQEMEITTLLISQEKNVFLVCSKKFKHSFNVNSRIKSHIRDLEKKGVGKHVNGEIWIYKTRE